METRISRAAAQELQTILRRAKPIADGNLDDAGCDKLADLPHNRLGLVAGTCWFLRTNSCAAANALRRGMGRPMGSPSNSPSDTIPVNAGVFRPGSACIERVHKHLAHCCLDGLSRSGECIRHASAPSVSN